MISVAPFSHHVKRIRAGEKHKSRHSKMDQDGDPAQHPQATCLLRITRINPREERHQNGAHGKDDDSSSLEDIRLFLQKQERRLQVRRGVAIKVWTLRASCFREYGFCSKNMPSLEIPLCSTMSSVYPET